MPTTDESVSGLPSLRSVMREGLNESLSAHPGDALPLILSKISKRDYAHYLTEAMSSMLSSIVGEARVELPPARPNRSAKVAAVRESYWPQLLRERVLGADGWIFLRDATSGDLRFIASHRREQAAALTAKAERFDHLADLLDSNQAETLGDLREDDGLIALGGAA